MKRLFTVILILILISTTLTGCWDEKIYDRLGLILNVGIELSGNNNLLITITTPVFDPESSTKVELITQEVSLIRENREKDKNISPNLIESGKLQQILISKDLAEKGSIHKLLEIFERDKTLSTLAHVVIVDGSPKEVLEAAIHFKAKPKPSLYLNRLLENNIRSSYTPETRVPKFNILYYAEGVDPVTPIIKLEKDNVRVIGSALFSNDKMVGTLNTKQTSILLAMKNEMHETNYILKNVDNRDKNIPLQGTAIDILRHKRKIDISLGNPPKINVILDFKGVVEEYSWKSLSNENNKKLYETYTAEDIQKTSYELLKYLQQCGADPVGFGNLVRSEHNSYWRSHDWKAAYKNAVITSSASFKIINHGLLN